MARAVERYSANRFLVAGAKHFNSRVQEIARHAPGADNWAVVSDGLGGPFDGVGSLVEQMGASRLLYGSRLPLLYAEAAQEMVGQSLIAEDERRQIMGANAARLFGLPEAAVA